MTDLPVKGTLSLRSHKGYQATAQYDADDNVFHGRVVGTRDVISFEGESIPELVTNFQSAVDSYLAVCTSRGEQPEKPFSGKLLLRMSPALHGRLHDDAIQAGDSLNSYVCRILESHGKQPQLITGIHSFDWSDISFVASGSGAQPLVHASTVWFSSSELPPKAPSKQNPILVGNVRKLTPDLSFDVSFPATAAAQFATATPAMGGRLTQSGNVTKLLGLAAAC